MSASRAVAQAQQPKYPVPGGGFATAPTRQLTLPPLPAPAAITPNGTVVEDVIARVNDQIITRSEYQRAEQQLLEESQQQGVSAAEFEDHRANLLRDMIDQQLLLSKGKELDITGDAETMRRLDDIRKQNHLDSMEALEKAAEQQGVSFEDFKQQIKNQVITQQVVRDEVGRRLNLTHQQEETYYAAHAKDFEAPEQVHLSEILVPTADNATDAQIASAQATADALEAKLKAGAEFRRTRQVLLRRPHRLGRRRPRRLPARQARRRTGERHLLSARRRRDGSHPHPPGLCHSARGQPPGRRRPAARRC